MQHRPTEPFQRAASGQQEQQSGDTGQGDKPSQDYNIEPTIQEKKLGAALDEQSASRTRYNEICQANARSRSRDLDLSRGPS